MTRTGILHQMWAEASISDRTCLENAAADVRLADELGYDSFWFGEHHYNRQKAFFGRVPVPELVIARLAAETRQIHLGTGVKVLSLEPAARAAEKMALLDILTDGRAEFGLGEGTKGSFFKEEEKGPLFRKSLREVVACLTEGSSDGRLALTPAPEHDLRPMIWSAVRNQESIFLSAELGLNFATGQGGLGPDQRVWVDIYREAGGRGEVRGYRLVLVAESDAEAERISAPARELYYSMIHQGAFAAQGDAEAEAEAFQRENFILGSPETVAERLLAYKLESGVDRVDLLAHVPGLPHEALQQTLVLYAQEVAPKVGVTMRSPLAA
jgi:alkanesulfonate monooxygenase SsuD/methylene tetrahydromethanopterin reductase-like flavin-dependent oxidoreductase (luciferase family)